MDAIFPCEFGFFLSRRTLTHVCVLMPIGQVTLVTLQTGFLFDCSNKLPPQKYPTFTLNICFQSINFFARSISLS
jgi:hypothetical protein